MNQEDQTCTPQPRPSAGSQKIECLGRVFSFRGEDVSDRGTSQFGQWPSQEVGVTWATLMRFCVGGMVGPTSGILVKYPPAHFYFALDPLSLFVVDRDGDDSKTSAALPGDRSAPLSPPPSPATTLCYQTWIHLPHSSRAPGGPSNFFLPNHHHQTKSSRPSLKTCQCALRSLHPPRPRDGASPPSHTAPLL